jgi:hypothetical protein
MRSLIRSHSEKISVAIDSQCSMHLQMPKYKATVKNQSSHRVKSAGQKRPGKQQLKCRGGAPKALIICTDGQNAVNALQQAVTATTCSRQNFPTHLCVWPAQNHHKLMQGALPDRLTLGRKQEGRCIWEREDGPQIHHCMSSACGDNHSYPRKKLDGHE